MPEYSVTSGTGLTLMPECRCRTAFSGIPAFTYDSSILSVRYLNDQKCRCRNQFSTEIRGPSPVPECFGTGLWYQMTKCLCRRHRHRYRYLAMLISITFMETGRLYSTYSNCTVQCKNDENTIIFVLEYFYRKSIQLRTVGQSDWTFPFRPRA